MHKKPKYSYQYLTYDNFRIYPNALIQESDAQREPMQNTGFTFWIDAAM